MNQAGVIADETKPKCFGEYLTHVQTLQILEIDSIDIDQACEFLDKAYDFTPHKTNPRCTLLLKSVVAAVWLRPMWPRKRSAAWTPAPRSFTR